MKKCHDFLKDPSESVSVLSFLVTFCLIALDFVCLFLWRSFTFAYVIYALSAIFLAFSVFLFVKAYPKIKQKFVALLEKSKLTKRFVKDKNFRKTVLAVTGSVANIAYLALLTVSAVISRSAWIALLAGYYFLLILTKTVLLFGELKIIKGRAKDKERKAIKIYHNTGTFFVIMAILLSGMIIRMANAEAGATYKDLFVYVVATYTFFKLILTIADIFKERCNRNFVIKAIVNIGAVEAMVSSYFLQLGMTKTFGESDPAAFNMASGICLCVAIFVLGAFILANGQEEISYIKKQNFLKSEAAKDEKFQNESDTQKGDVK